jgi:hypothetical protein
MVPVRPLAGRAEAEARLRISVIGSRPIARNSQCDRGTRNDLSAGSLLLIADDATAAVVDPAAAEAHLPHPGGSGRHPIGPHSISAPRARKRSAVSWLGEMPICAYAEHAIEIRAHKLVNKTAKRIIWLP